MANKVIGLEFHRIVNTCVLEAVSKATVSLHHELIYTPEDISNEIIIEKFDELRKTINTYIDGQKETLIKLQKV